MNDEMEFEEKFEAGLTQALQRVNAPEGFAARIMDRVAEPARVAKPVEAKSTVMPGKVIAFRSRANRYAGLGLAAMLALGVLGMEQLHQRHEREVATQQFETATRITDQAMEHTRRQLERAGVPLN